jgi:tRNA A-37 threonylcarbamoyl transferase component Bud32
MSNEKDAQGTGGETTSGKTVDVAAETRILEAPAPGDAVDASAEPAEVTDEKTAPPPARTELVAEAEGMAAGDEVDVDAATRVAGRSYAKPSSPAAGANPSPPGIKAGDVLFGEYEIVEVLGAGGMGEVYKAKHRRLGEYRAIKMMHAALSGKKGANEFFLREAKALLAVRHPAVVHCHDLLSDAEGRVYLIMEMIDGESVADLMEDGPLSPDDVVRLGARLSAGLAAAHERGVVHRDISPDNIVLPDGDVSQAKLIDFGIAKILDEGQGTIVEGFKGKLSYASPEQLGFFGGKIDGRSDFYSLGLVLCAASLGHPLGMGKTVVEAVDARRELQRVPDDIPVGLRASIEPLLALDPADRPEFAERLFVAPGQAGPDYRPATGTRGPSAGDGRGMLIPGIVAACALAAGIAAFVFVGEDPPVAPVPAAVPQTSLPVLPEPVAVREPAPTRKPAPPPALTPLQKMKIVGLLRGAEGALKDGRLQSPKGDNAYEKYRGVLKLDPANEDARMGLVDVTSRYIGLSRKALAAGKVEDAAGFVARAASITPHHPDLPAARAAVARATAKN